MSMTLFTILNMLNTFFKHNSNKFYSYQVVMIQKLAVFNVTELGLKIGKFFTS